MKCTLASFFSKPLELPCWGRKEGFNTNKMGGEGETNGGGGYKIKSSSDSKPLYNKNRNINKNNRDVPRLLAANVAVNTSTYAAGRQADYTSVTLTRKLIGI